MGKLRPKEVKKFLQGHSAVSEPPFGLTEPGLSGSGPLVGEDPGLGGWVPLPREEFAVPVAFLWPLVGRC